MIEIRACTPDDAAALSTLLSEHSLDPAGDREHPRVQQNRGGSNYCCRRGRSDSWASRSTPVSNVAIRKSGCARYGLSG
jgi:hypothetical protein